MGVAFPDHSDYDKNTWETLAGFWHPVERLGAIGDSPVAAQLLDVPLVLYRTKQGITVASDYCPHRGAKLSNGWVEGDNLICPYHGLEFNPAGQCVRVPAAEPHRDNCDAIKLATVMSVEQYGVLWVCLSGDPKLPLPVWSALDDQSLQSVHMEPATWSASAGRHAENFNDVAHLSFIHAGTFGNRDDPLIERYEVDRTEVGLNRTFTYNQVDRDTFNDDQGTVTPMTYAYSFTYPFSSTLLISSSDQRDLYIYDCVCPVSPTVSKIFISIARNYDLQQPVEDLVEFQGAVNEEDRVVVESQFPKKCPLDPRKEKHIMADAWSLQFRSGFVALGLDRETYI